MKNKKISSSRGFSLIELVVYMGVFAVFISITTSIFTTVLGVQIESQSTSTVQQNGTYLIERLSYDIHRAEDINIPVSAGIQTQELELLINGEVFTYSLNMGTLELTNNSGTHTMNSSDITITNLSFLRLGNPGGKHSLTIDIAFESTLADASGPEELSLHTTLGIR